VIAQAISRRQLLSFEYYKENEDELSTRTLEPYQLVNGREGWYVAGYDPAREDVRHFRLDRIKSANVSEQAFEPRPEVEAVSEVDGWLRTGEVAAARRARVWISPERARWAREDRTVIGDYADGSVVVEIGFAGLLEHLPHQPVEAGDAVVLEPADAREAVRAAALALESAATPV
jgi:predicted DNA-binding transcriptional regulator YafY